jgi:transposase InsO family protein
MKKRNPRYGYRRIAMQIINAFGILIDKDIVRRVLAKHYKPESNDDGPSWLTFIGNMKDSLWSIDLFRTESMFLKTHWVMVIMDQFTRRIIGIATHAGYVDGIALCCMFNKIIAGKKSPKYLSMDNDPLFNFHRWKVNLRVVEIKEIKSVPYAPRTHTFIERLIGSIRREFLDRILFWTKTDLQNKLNIYQQYYNESRGHYALNAQTPVQKALRTGIKKR